MTTKKNATSDQIGLFKNKRIEMPEGYYSGDKPNRNIKNFIQEHLKKYPFDISNDDYEVSAFTKPQTVKNRRDPLNDLHIYWSKKPYSAIRKYILHYTKPNDLLLDPMCGSGSTALASLIEGRKAIAIDRSPAATFITKNYCTPVNTDELIKAYSELKKKTKDEISWLYATKCDRCRGDASIAYTVYSQVFRCQRCFEKVPLADCVTTEIQSPKGKNKKITACPHCYKQNIVEEINSRGEKFGFIPIRVNYICKGGCKPVRSSRCHNDQNKKKREYFALYDLGKIEAIEKKKIPYWYPKDCMMNSATGEGRWGVLWRPYLKGVKRVCDFYTKRSLWALSIYKNEIEKFGYQKDRLLFAFSGTIYNASRMYQEREAGGGPAKGIYYTPPIFREVAVDTLLEQKISVQIRSANLWVPQKGEVPLMVSTENATSLSDIANDSIDYIFTDPPYSWKIQFGESNFIWEAWLKLDTNWHEDEIIVNAFRSKTEADWACMIREVMSECWRVLKPGRWLSLCYHDTSEGTWELVQDILAEVGFIVDKSDQALFIDTGQKAWKQIVADKVSKRDLVVNFRKPKHGEIAYDVVISGNEDKQTFNEKVKILIRDYLEQRPGSTKDKIYDQIVSRMIRSGEMEAHNFEELLGQIAESVKQPIMKNLFEKKAPDLFGGHEVIKWYLKRDGTDEVDNAEAKKEDIAANVVSKYIEEYLKKRADEEGVHFSDLFEHYVYNVKNKPRRQFKDWLIDYLFINENGTYRAPITEEEERIKADARKKGIIRHIRRYVKNLEIGETVPDSIRVNDTTIAEWIRHCKRNGLYEKGKFLYEKGGINPNTLPEEIMVLVEEDYQVCVRMLKRKKL